MSAIASVYTTRVAFTIATQLMQKVPNCTPIIPKPNLYKKEDNNDDDHPPPPSPPTLEMPIPDDYIFDDVQIPISNPPRLLNA